MEITWKLLHLILPPHKDINKTNSRCNPAINLFYKHILHQHVDQHNQNPPVSQLERREEVIWSESCALWPKPYSEMKFWVTLAVIFVYLIDHFKIDCDGCVSGYIHLSECLWFSIQLFSPFYHFIPHSSSTYFALVALTFISSRFIFWKVQGFCSQIIKLTLENINVRSLRVLYTPFLHFWYKHLKWFKFTFHAIFGNIWQEVYWT